MSNTEKRKVNIDKVSGRVFYFDFIRAVAILMILIFHFNERIVTYLAVPEKLMIGNVSLLNLGGVNLALGNWGVSLFLILSGASLMYTYQDKLEWKRFYKKYCLFTRYTTWHLLLF